MQINFSNLNSSKIYVKLEKKSSIAGPMPGPGWQVPVHTVLSLSYFHNFVIQFSKTGISYIYIYKFHYMFFKICSTWSECVRRWIFSYDERKFSIF